MAMPPKLGIIAGGGDLPVRLVEACRRSGRDVYLVAIEGQADSELPPDVEHMTVRLGAALQGFDWLREAGVEELVLAGRIERPSLAALRPTGQTAKFLAKLGRSIFAGDDGLLRALIEGIEEQGFRVVGVDEVMGEVVAREGPYGRLEPDAEARADIERGVSVARALGAADVGQAVVVQQGIVLGVEAIEGTDALLRRCAGLARAGSGGVLVKLKKPGQERRADLPTIGVDTVRRAQEAGLRGIAVEAGGTLVLDAEAVGAAADAAGLFVVGIAPPS